MSRRRIGNPLALAVLVTLAERPMHPYEVATTLRSRAKHESIKLNYGSLYTVVNALLHFGLIEPLETGREGGRPERTVYRITDPGRLEMLDWLGELISTPVKEYTQFEAGLSLLPALPPSEATWLLQERGRRLEADIGRLRAVHAVAKEKHLPRLFSVESEYHLALLRADLAFTTELVQEIEGGTLDGLEVWRQLHAAGPWSGAAPEEQG